MSDPILDPKPAPAGPAEKKQNLAKSHHQYSGGTAECLNCCAVFAEEELLPYGEESVCSNCKDVFLKKLEQGVPLGFEQAWRKNRNVILLPESSEFPDRCVCCNAPGEVRKTKVFSYLPQSSRTILLAAFLVMNILVVIPLFFMQKRIPLTFSYCERHIRQRKVFAWVGGGLIGLTGIIPASYWTIVFFMLGVCSLALATVQIRVKKQTDETVEFSGVGKRFSDSLADWNGG